MKITQNKKNPKLSDIDCYISNKRIRKKGLTQLEINKLLLGSNLSKYKPVKHFTWREAYQDANRLKWDHNICNNASNWAFKVLNDADVWLLDPNQTNVLDLFNLIDTYTHPKTGEPLKGQSKNNYVKAIKTILNIAGGVTKKLVIDKSLPTFVNQPSKKRDIFKKKNERIIDEWYKENANAEDYAYWQSLTYLGCRPIELERLRWKDVDVDDESLILTSFKGAGAAREPMRRALPLPKIEWFNQEDVNEGDPVFPNYNRHRLYKLFAKMRKETGLNQKNVNFVQYSARHTKITNFAKANHNASKIQKWAGHSKFETTKTYIDLVADDLKDMA